MLDSTAQKNTEQRSMRQKDMKQKDMKQKDMRKKGMRQSKKRVLGILLTAALTLSIFCGCDEEYVDGYETDGQGLTGEEDTLSRGSGLEMGMGIAELEEDPSKAVRRSVVRDGQVLAVKLDGTVVPEDFYLYRNTLSSQNQRAYDQICNGFTQGKDSIPMTVPITEKDMEELFFAIVYDHPELFWVRPNYYYHYDDNGYITEVNPLYYDMDMATMQSEVEENIKDALADMWSLADDVEKVKYAHDYLTHTIDYVANDLDQSAYSGFVNGQTVCAGYSKCFAYMMQKMGIPCTVVIGSANGENHSWNLLELDGEYYTMDVTWDDPIGNDADTYYYDYFNITDSQLGKDHSKGTFQSDSGTIVPVSLALPTANGTRYSFQNAFGGDAYGTDFSQINGELPDTYTGVASVTGNTEDTGSDAEDTYYWWNLLDDNWTKEDWKYEDGAWYIWDEETQCTYIYVEEDDVFGAMEDGSEEVYWLDAESGEWILE